MSKSEREQEVFYIGANATSTAYRLGMKDFNNLIIRLENMKRLGFIESYSFRDYLLWITTNKVITNRQWDLGLDEVNNLLDSLEPKKEKITVENMGGIKKGDRIVLGNGIEAYFVRWSWFNSDYAVLLGLENVHKKVLIGATKVPKHLVEVVNE